MSHTEHAQFGNPDGSRADLEEILQGFVSFGGSAAWGGLGTRQDDLTVRVLVGRKGSGKTVYLRRLQAHAGADPSVYADYIQQSLPSTASIVKFCQWFDESVLTEQWMEVWHRAIIRSVVTHILNQDRLRSLLPRTLIQSLKTDFSEILSDTRAPVSIYSQVKAIIESHTSSHHVVKLLQNPLWDELESVLAEHINELPPMCFYIDAVDEEFVHAPMYWLRCQKGLFYQTMRLLRDAKLGGRLHIVICIRESVLSSVLRSEHRTRYEGEPHIRTLVWNKEAILHFLNRKIKLLPHECFVGNLEAEGRTVTTWLGRSTIHNVTRNVEEPITDYLLRHTRLLPRDVVVMGNELCRAIAKAKHFSNGQLTEQIIRDTVAKASRALGNEQLQIAGTQVLSSSMPERAGVYGYSDAYTSYTGNAEHLKSVADELKRIIECIGKDRFSGDDMVAARKLAEESFGKHSDPFSALWQHGLIGCVEMADSRERVRFYTDESLDDFNLPERDWYVFHSCVIDSAKVTPVNATPVLPF